MSLEAGQLSGISGRTGAGKTTCVRAFNGLIPHVIPGDFRGRVELFGRPLERANRHEAIRRVGMVFQDFEAQLFSTTVRGEVAFVLETAGLTPAAIQARVTESLARVGLAPLAEREPSTLSGGQKQRLAIACLLAARPDILVLDEPTTDLDPIGKSEVAAILHELAGAGHTVALVEHETDLLARARRIHLLADGSLSDTRSLDGFRDDPERLLAYGIRPPDLWRLWRRLGMTDPPDDIEGAARRLRENGFVTAPPASAEPSPSRNEPLFVLDRVGFAYPDGNAVLADFSLTIRRGESLAVLGPNGAGKTTLIGLLNGLRRPTQGRVLFRGEDIARQSVGRLGADIGFVFQNPDHQLFSPTVFEEVAFALKVRGAPAADWPAKVERVLALVGLTGVEDRDPFTMTKGERQKLALAAVLVHEPEVLILDEPTTGLDAAEQEVMADLLRALQARGHTVLIITHSMDTALAVADRALVLVDGRTLADGPTREVFADENRLAAAQLRPPAAARLSADLGYGALSLAALEARLQRRPS